MADTIMFGDTGQIMRIYAAPGLPCRRCKQRFRAADPGLIVRVVDEPHAYCIALHFGCAMRDVINAYSRATRT